MTGLLIYVWCALGLGGLLKPLPIGHIPWAGLRTFIGFCLIQTLFYLLHILFGVGFQMSAFVVLGLSSIGVCKLILEFKTAPSSSDWPISPPFIVIVLVGAVVGVIIGGMAYIPYSGDEFAQWIGAARYIFIAGGFPEALTTLPYPGFTPGWALTLTFPMAFSGQFDESLAAPAAFVFHAALIGMIFDLVRALIKTRSALTPFQVSLYAWGFILLFMAAEVNGQLVAVNLLIESAQVYLGTALLLLLVCWSDPDDRGLTTATYIGLLFAAAYLYKTAFIAMAPALLCACLIVEYTKWQRAAPSSLSALIRNTFISVLIIIGPMVLIYISWKLNANTKGCMASPFSLLQQDNLTTVLNDETIAYAGRFTDKLWAYLSTYKLPLTVFTVFALAAGLSSKQHRAAIIAVSVYFIAFQTAFFLYMATCSSEQYTTTERYTRVILQPAHALATLIALYLLMSNTWEKTWFNLNIVLKSRYTIRLSIGMVAILGVLQFNLIYQKFEDLKIRDRQAIDPQIPVISKHIPKIKSLLGSENRQETRVLVLDDHWSDGHSGMLGYFSMGNKLGEGPDNFETTLWNVATRGEINTDQETFFRKVETVDAIWPLKFREADRPHILKLVQPLAATERLDQCLLIRVAPALPMFRCQILKTNN